MLEGAALTPKLVTVTCRSDGDENAMPLLLALTDIVLSPNGHVIVDPGDVPQPPIQVTRVSPQPFGSTKPSAAGVRLAPEGALPLTIRSDLPLKIGSVFD